MLIMHKSVDYYLCLLFVVLPIRAIVYLSPVMLAALIANQMGLAGESILSSMVALPLIVYLCAECVFTLHYLHKKAKAGALHPNPPTIQAVNANRPHHSVGSAMEFFDKMMTHIDDVPRFVEGHFYGVSYGLLSKLDVAKWSAFVFFTKTYDDTSAAERGEIDAIVAKLHAIAPLQCSVHTQRPSFPFLQPNLDPFEATARPLALYMATIGANYVVSFWLRWHGFQHHHVTGAVGYWHRPPSSLDHSTDLPPLAFVHGVGIGLPTYIPLLHTMFGGTTNRHVFLLDLPFIAMQLRDDSVPDKAHVLDAIADMLTEQNVTAPVHWVGHSFGTIVMSWVCQERPHLVHYLTFVDPVVFACWQHHGIYNLMYKAPSTGLNLLLWYFASQEIGIACSMRRHLTWYETVLFPDHLPRHPHTNHVVASVFLSENDCIIDAPGAHAHLERGVLQDATDALSPRLPIHTTLWRGITHGELILYASAHADVMATVVPTKTVH
ncbi:hypothetical protein H257_05619 [Aphanomyces astaci]|uniref:AB hydrolase-1 domain-containing protein n=1 Tax=Aphanomyces astaci TaxID=112090 RepID=W4GR03_APHAT|nr:hypothetical protein H257_05619 [Aphanomyces astaci]ETV82117.1 hypothetical protein H257_05619 [Aphanomyces astaci]|eukprot:XP_009828854.1 hypothetical protein H257_05619 [Aphanomyces astaci]